MKIKIITTLLTALFTLSCFAQNPFPYSAPLLTADGKKVMSSAFTNDGKPLIVDFWGSFCKPCIIKYNSLAKIYPEWQKETGVKIIAISIDKTEKGIQKSRELAKIYNWPFEFYYDSSNVLFNLMTSKISVPQAFFFDGSMKLRDSTDGAELVIKGGDSDEDKVFSELYKKDRPVDAFECNLSQYFRIVGEMKKKKDETQKP